MFNDGAERKSGEKRKRSDQNDSAHQQADKERTVRWQGAAGGRDFLFASQVAGRAASSGMRKRKRPASIATPSVRLYQGVFALIPAKALPLLPTALE